MTKSTLQSFLNRLKSSLSIQLSADIRSSSDPTHPAPERRKVRSILSPAEQAELATANYKIAHPNATEGDLLMFSQKVLNNIDESAKKTMSPAAAERAQLILTRDSFADRAKRDHVKVSRMGRTPESLNIAGAAKILESLSRVDTGPDNLWAAQRATSIVARKYAKLRDFTFAYGFSNETPSEPGVVGFKVSFAIRNPEDNPDDVLGELLVLDRYFNDDFVSREVTPSELTSELEFNHIILEMFQDWRNSGTESAPGVVKAI